MDKDLLKKKPHQIQPFLRWTGSKRWFIKDHIEKYLPLSFNNYHEPFLGGGSVFFHLVRESECVKRKYYLSDSNEELINAYQQIKNNPLKLISALMKMINTKDEYYKVRSQKSNSVIKQAARFIYLNRTSFNGIYRVNSRNEYNVPYGKRPTVDIVTKELILSINSCMKDVNIDSKNFTSILKNIKRNDLVFLDPPYTVAHENNGFIEYNQKLFSWDDQLKLKKMLESISDRGAYFILTNASHPSIIELYSDVAKIQKVARDCKVGGRLKTRGVYNEVVIFNTKL